MAILGSISLRIYTIKRLKSELEAYIGDLNKMQKIKNGNRISSEVHRPIIAHTEGAVFHRSTHKCHHRLGPVTSVHAHSVKHYVYENLFQFENL